MNDSDADMISVLKLRGGRRPITVSVRVNSQDLTMELDTGAAVSVISEKTFNRLLPTAKLHPTSLLLRTYTGQPLTVVGQLKDIEVTYGACTHSLSHCSGRRWT